MSLAVFSRPTRAVPAPPGRTPALARRCRIFILDGGFGPEAGDSAKFAAELGVFLASRGHDVEAVIPSRHEGAWRDDKGPRPNFYRRVLRQGAFLWSCPQGGDDASRLAPWLFGLFSAPLTFWRVLRGQPEVVICVEPRGPGALAALVAARLVGARRIAHLQDSEIPASESPIAAARAALLRRFDQLATNSRRMRDLLIARGLAPEKCAVFHNWIDAEALRPKPRGAPNFYREMLDLGPQYFIALYAGALTPHQGLEVILAAARQCRAQKYLRFVIVGDGPARQRLVAAASDLDNLCFLSSQPPERYDDLLAFADIHLIAQPADAAAPAFPPKLGRLLASGRPILATAEESSELGAILAGAAILTPPGDAAALAEALNSAMTRDLSTLGARGRALAHWFTARTILSAFEAAICAEPPITPIV